MSKKKVATLIVQFENSLLDPKVDKLRNKINKLISKNRDVVIGGAAKVFPNLKSLEDSGERFYAKDEVLKFKWVKPSITKKGFEGMRDALPFFSIVRDNNMPTLAQMANELWNANNGIIANSFNAPNNCINGDCEYCEYNKDYQAFLDLLGEENDNLITRTLDAGFTSEILEGWDKEKALVVLNTLDKLGKI